MAASQEQKVDFLLKKIGYTASKTGIAEDETGISGTKKAPFAEPIPSPLTLPGANIWSQSNQIPATPPGATTSIVRVYKTGTAQQLTFDSTVADNRSFVARETPGEVTSTVVGDWVDTQFGSDYIVKVYKGDPNAGGVQLSAAGSGSNDTWFFDYSAGVLNFNGTNVPSGITTTNIYIEGYRYTGIKGITGVAQTFTDLEVSGITTFNGAVDMNSTLDVDGDTQLDDLTVAGVATFSNNIDANGTLDVDGDTQLDDLNVSGVSTFKNDVEFHGVDGISSITFDKSNNSLNFLDNAKITIGTGSDLNLFHDGFNSFIQDTGTGQLRLQTSELNVVTGFQNSMIKATSEGSVKIYHGATNSGSPGADGDTKLKLETTSTGVVVTGIATATTFSGNISGVGATFTNLTGTLQTAAQPNITSLGTLSAVTVSGNINANGNIVGDSATNITGIAGVTASTLTGTLQTAAQPNVTSLGTITNLVASSAKVSDLTSGRVVYVGTAGELQDSNNLTFDGTTLDGVFSGDGSALTGITAGGVGAIGGLTVKDEGVVVGTAGSVSTFDFRGAAVTAIANTGAAGIATVTIATEQQQDIQTLNVSGISTFNGNINLISNDSGSSAAPEFKLYRNSATPANADYLGQIKFAGESSTGVERNYAKITGKILDSNNGSEDGILEFAHIKNGSQTITGRWRSDSLQLLNGTSLTVAGDVSATNFNSTSDARLKTNVQTITSPLEKLNQIDGVSFDWVADLNPYEDESSSMGVIADTVEKVLPVLVAEHDTGYKTVNYNGLIGLLIEAVKEQQVQITELKTKLDSLS